MKDINKRIEELGREIVVKEAFLDRLTKKLGIYHKRLERMIERKQKKDRLAEAERLST